jgi:hypothetical protein
VRPYPTTDGYSLHTPKSNHDDEKWIPTRKGQEGNCQKTKGSCSFLWSQPNNFVKNNNDFRLKINSDGNSVVHGKRLFHSESKQETCELRVLKPSQPQPHTSDKLSEVSETANQNHSTPVSSESVLAFAELIKPCPPSTTETADDMLMETEEEVSKLEQSANQIRQGFGLLLNPQFFEIISSISQQ